MRVFVFSLIGLILLAVVADYGTAAYTEYRVSREIRHELVLNTDPDVRITGFPFLTQMAKGDFSQVNVHVAGVPMAGLATVTIGATLRNAKVSAAQVFGGDPNHIVVGELDSRIRINDTQLGQLLGIPDLTVSAPVADPTLGTSGGDAFPAPRSGIILTGTVQLGGLIKQRISVNANVALQGKTVRIIATSLASGGRSPQSLALTLGGPVSTSVTLTPPLTEIAMQKFSLTLDSDHLPFGIAPTTVHAEGADIVIEGKHTNVVISRTAHSAPTVRR